MSTFFKGFVDNMIQFDFCKQKHAQCIDKIGHVSLVLGYLL